MIELTDVYKSYQRGRTSTQVLQGVNLSIKRGQCVFLMGPSGSGKSTLLSILGCILTPDSGRVSIMDYDAARLSPQQRATLRRDHIGFVFQRFHLLRGLSAIDNVMLPLKLANEPARTIRKRAQAMLDMVDLPELATASPQNMSAGQCQRIAIARALAADPSIILADEPTASLDGDTGHHMMELLLRLTQRQNKTVIVVTHDHRILPFADTLYRLDHGRLTMDDCGAEHLRN
jgi:putative ABC transport system ATP-binding protein